MVANGDEGELEEKLSNHAARIATGTSTRLCENFRRKISTNLRPYDPYSMKLVRCGKQLAVLGSS
jgi:hypothetical protein